MYITYDRHYANYTNKKDRIQVKLQVFLHKPHVHFKKQNMHMI